MIKNYLNNKYIVLLYIFLSFPILSFSNDNLEDICDKKIKSAIQAAENKNHIQSIELLMEAKSIAESNNLHKQLFWVLTNIGINYAEMLDYSEALDNFLEAYKIALKELDTRSEMSILNNIAGLYFLDKKFDKAEEYYLKVFNYAKHIEDSALIGGSAINMILIANEAKNIEEADKYYEVAEKMLINNSRSLLKAKSLRINTLILKKEYDTAEKLALELLPLLDNINFKDIQLTVLISLIGVYNATNNIDKAISYANIVLSFDTNIEYKIGIYNTLSELYQKNRNYNLALNYKDSVYYATDSLNQIKNGKHFENSRIKFELLKNQKELSDSQTKLRNERTIYLLIVFIAIILIWAFRNNSIKERQRKKIVELELEQEKNKKLLLEKQIKEQDALVLLEKERMVNEQEKLKYEIESKNRELAAKALFMSNRNELIENIINSLSTSNKISNNPELVKYIHQLKNQLKENTEWDGFISHFENVNQEFINSLREKHSDLKAHEIRFLSYIYINLNTKEIASLLNITNEYCKKKKQQISHKLGLKSTSELYKYLSKL